jgi:hypothetical protein
VDVPERELFPHAATTSIYPEDVFRVCAFCDLSYNRTMFLEQLRHHCEQAWKIDFRRVADANRDEGAYRHEDWVP